MANRRFLFPVMVFSLLLFLPLRNAGATWTIEYAEVSKEFIHITQRSIAVDTGGHPHIAYGRPHLHYAYHDGTRWHYDVADTSRGVGDYASIALDPMGKAHISYFDGGNADLKYATNACGSWEIRTVDSTGVVGTYTSIATDSAGYAHISYIDMTNRDLKYATNAGGEWQTHKVDISGDIDQYTSIAVDVSGGVHISYCDSTLHVIKYATNSSGSWHTQAVDGSGDVGMYTSIGIDTAGSIHISYYDKTNRDLKYALKASGSWQTYRWMATSMRESIPPWISTSGGMSISAILTGRTSSTPPIHHIPTSPRILQPITSRTYCREVRQALWSSPFPTSAMWIFISPG
ncbi:MAG: hypothetical protein ACMUIS_09735 [bacterium]